MANMPPLTIRKPETLLNRLESLEAQVVQDAQSAQFGQRVERKLRINGAEVTFTVTPSVKAGRVYRLFRINGKRTAKEAVPQVLLPALA